jgi:outer membrane immunogenic protein
MSRVVLTAGFALCLFSGAALAADLPTKKEPPAPPPSAFNWTGFYLGANAGGAWVSSTASYPIAGPPGYLPYDPTGVFGGVYAGYNYQFSGNMVAGVEADINYGDLTGKTYYHFSPPGSGSIPEDTGKGELGAFGSGRVRLGYAFDRFLPYIAGGVAVADDKNTLVALSNSLFTGSYDHTMVGWTIGDGLDYAITNNIILRADYRYADYGKVTDTLTTNRFAVHTTSLRTNDARIGVAYKF